MNDPRDRRTLLNAILAETAAGDMRDVSLRRTLVAARHRRAMRRARAVGSTLALVAALGLLAWRINMPMPREAHDRQKSYVLVRTQKTPQKWRVESTPLAAAALVSSTPSAQVATIETSPDSPAYRFIDDATLLALASPTPAVLVRLGPNSAELILIPEDGGHN